MTDAFGIGRALEQLGIKDINEGTSTGLENFSSGELFESHSPVDGKLIGKVRASTKEDYERAMKAATEAFKTFRLMPARLVMKLY